MDAEAMVTELKEIDPTKKLSSLASWLTVLNPGEIKALLSAQYSGVGPGDEMRNQEELPF